MLEGPSGRVLDTKTQGIAQNSPGMQKMNKSEIYPKFPGINLLLIGEQVVLTSRYFRTLILGVLKVPQSNIEGIQQSGDL